MTFILQGSSFSSEFDSLAHLVQYLGGAFVNAVRTDDDALVVQTGGRQHHYFVYRQLGKREAYAPVTAASVRRIVKSI